MWEEDNGRRRDGQGPGAVGAEEVPRLLGQAPGAPGGGALRPLTPVLFSVTSDEEDLGEALMDSRARQDDAYWARLVRGRFSWRRYTSWWLARRWVVPRDVRRR